jgi:NADPH-dependent ferric siderophore reductase
VTFTKTLTTKAHPEGEEVVRKYTPISDLRQKGYVDFPIKIYRANTHPNFPDGGVMTQWLEALPIGETVRMFGPRGKMFYKGDSLWQYDNLKTEV